MSTDEKDLAELVAEDRARRASRRNAKAVAWMFVLPTLLVLGTGFEFEKVAQSMQGAMVFATILLSIGNGLVVANLRGWFD
jgi:hypothetical protein